MEPNWVKTKRRCENCNGEDAEVLIRRGRAIAWRCLSCGHGQAQRVDKQRQRYRQIRMSVPFEMDALLDSVRLLANADGMSLTEVSSRLWRLYEVDPALRELVRQVALSDKAAKPSQPDIDLAALQERV